MSSQPAGPTSSSLNTKIETFLQHGLYLRNWSPRTVRSYRYAIRGVPADLTKAALEQWVIGMRLADETPGGINVRIRVVNSFLSWLRSEGEMAPPPLKLLKTPKPIMQTLSVTEIKLLMALKAGRTRTLVLLLLDTGLRIDEALTLERAKVSLDDLTLAVWGKGSKERLVPFSHEMRKVLFRYLQKSQPSRYVFATRTGGRLEYQNIRRDVMGLCVQAGIPRNIHPHLFRHTFAAFYLRRGGDIYRLSRILGHTSINTTQIYLRSLGIDDFRAGLERLTPLAC